MTLWRKLGRTPSRIDPRTLRFSKYLATERAHAPAPMRDWSDAVSSFGMFRNDAIGCCTVAAFGHMIQAWTANNGHEVRVPTPAVVEAYTKISGYNPDDPTTDQGAQMIDMLRLSRRDGLAGHRAEAYVRLDDGNRLQIKIAANALGTVYIGADLPNAAKAQQVWDVAPAGKWTEDYTPGSWGGHAMALVGYDQLGVVLATWGAIKVATWEWMATYVSETWAVVSDVWAEPGRIAPSGLDLEQLRYDLEKIA